MPEEIKPARRLRHKSDMFKVSAVKSQPIPASSANNTVISKGVFCLHPVSIFCIKPDSAVCLTSFITLLSICKYPPVACNYEKRQISKFRRPALWWCGHGDSNPNVSLHENLNLACLPIPSCPHMSCISTSAVFSVSCYVIICQKNLH